MKLCIWLFVLDNYGINSLGELLFFEFNYIKDSIKQITLYQTDMTFILLHISL